MLTDNKVDTMLMVSRLIKEADLATGGRCSLDDIEQMTHMAIQYFKHRSVDSLVLALREGMGRNDDDGKVFGKLTWNKLKLWLDTHEEEILAMAHAGHAEKVVKFDNLGAQYMEDLEGQQSWKDKKMDRQQQEIDRLRKKLDHKK